jgi:CheY-like chemotaxis protein
MKLVILILDDQAQYLRSLERALRGEFGIRLAANQQEATQKLDHEVAVVLADIRLVESNVNDRQGLDFIRTARTQFPKLTIVAMSALDEAGIEAAAREAGANRFLRKPIIVTQLKELLHGLSASPAN